MKTILKVLIVAATASSIGCTGTNGTTTAIDSAEAYVATGNYSDARERLQTITDTAGLRPSDLCRMGITYVAISEGEDTPEDLASAAECYISAMTMNADSVDAFVATLPAEQKESALLMRAVARQLVMPCDVEEDFEPTEETAE